jgi:hypothetical protein
MNRPTTTEKYSVLAINTCRGRDAATDVGELTRIRVFFALLLIRAAVIAKINLLSV